jgi:hypothetical protein
MKIVTLGDVREPMLEGQILICQCSGKIEVPIEEIFKPMRTRDNNEPKGETRQYGAPSKPHLTSYGG